MEAAQEQRMNLVWFVQPELSLTAAENCFTILLEEVFASLEAVNEPDLLSYENRSLSLENIKSAWEYVLLVRSNYPKGVIADTFAEKASKKTNEEIYLNILGLYKKIALRMRDYIIPDDNKRLLFLREINDLIFGSEVTNQLLDTVDEEFKTEYKLPNSILPEDPFYSPLHKTDRK
ncbi:MAG: hypothetical protein ABI721_01490 [Candidatus Dojkabacteria bacterium]